MRVCGAAVGLSTQGDRRKTRRGAPGARLSGSRPARGSSGTPRAAAHSLAPARPVHDAPRRARAPLHPGGPQCQGCAGSPRGFAGGRFGHPEERLLRIRAALPDGVRLWVSEGLAGTPGSFSTHSCFLLSIRLLHFWVDGGVWTLWNSQIGQYVAFL